MTTIVVKEETMAKLKKLQDTLHEPSLTDIVRRAVEVYEYLLTNQDNGYNLLLRDWLWHEKEIVLIKGEE